MCLEGKRQHAHKNVPNKERKTNKDHGAMPNNTDNAKPYRPENSLWKQIETYLTLRDKGGMESGFEISEVCG